MKTNNSARSILRFWFPRLRVRLFLSLKTADKPFIPADCFEHLQGKLPEKMAAAELGKEVEGRFAGVSFAPFAHTSGEGWMTATKVSSVARKARV